MHFMSFFKNEISSMFFFASALDSHVLFISALTCVFFPLDHLY